MTGWKPAGKALGYREESPPGSRTDHHNSEWNDDQLFGAMTRRVADHGIYRRAAELASPELDGRSDEDLATQLIGGLLDPVELVSGPYRHELVGGDTLYDDVGHPTHSKRLPLTWTVRGAVEWLAHWPWKAQHQPRDPVELERSRSRHAAYGRWTGSPYTVEPGVIHSYVDVFDDDDPIEEVRARRIEDRTNYLHEYLAAHAEAVATCAVRARQIVRDAVADRRRDVTFVAAALEGLDLPLAPRPAIEIDDSQQGVDKVELLPPALTSASFANIVSAIDSWRTTIEVGARHLHRLDENGLTFTLLPTLQATFGAAHHGTFVHSGAADITIPVRQLAAIHGREINTDESDIFVAEAKKGTGAKLAAGAKDQLDRYLTRRTRHACLIFYVTADAFYDAFEGVLSGLRGHPDFDRDLDPIGNVPVLQFHDPLSRVARQVAVVGVALPDVASQPVEDARRAEARNLRDASSQGHPVLPR